MIFESIRINLIKRYFFVWILIVILGCGVHGLLFAQKGMTITYYGMPQRTYMTGVSNKEQQGIIDQYYQDNEGRAMLKKPSYNFAFGFLFKHIINRRISLGYGFQFSPFEQKYKVYDIISDEYFGLGINLKYIKVNISFDYRFIEKEKYDLFFSLGPQLSILISENGGVPVYGTNRSLITFPLLEYVDPGGIYKNFVMGSFFQLGAEIKMDNKISFLTQLYCDGTFTQVQNKSFRDAVFNENIFEYPLITIISKNNISTGVSLGLVYKIR